MVHAGEILAKLCLLHWLILIQATLYAVKQYLGEDLVHNREKTDGSIVVNILLLTFIED